MRRLNEQLNSKNEHHRQMIQEKDAAFEQLHLLHQEMIKKESSKNNLQKFSDIFFAKRVLSNKNEQLVASNDSKANQSGNVSSNALLGLHITVNNNNNP